jgi:hypothetical protein
VRSGAKETASLLSASEGHDAEQQQQAMESEKALFATGPPWRIAQEDEEDEHGEKGDGEDEEDEEDDVSIYQAVLHHALFPDETAKVSTRDRACLIAVSFLLIFLQIGVSVGLNEITYYTACETSSDCEENMFCLHHDNGHGVCVGCGYVDWFNDGDVFNQTYFPNASAFNCYEPGAGSPVDLLLYDDSGDVSATSLYSGDSLQNTTVDEIILALKESGNWTAPDGQEYLADSNPFCIDASNELAKMCSGTLRSSFSQGELLVCRADLCGDSLGDCCAEWYGEERVCKEDGYSPRKGGTSSYELCNADHIYECCSSDPAEVSRQARDHFPLFEVDEHFSGTKTGDFCEGCYDVDNSGAISHLSSTTDAKWQKNVRMMTLPNWLAYILAAVLVSVAFGKELDDVARCNLVCSIYTCFQVSDGWWYCVVTLQLLRQFVLCPLLLSTVPLMVGFQGADTMSICFNAVAVVFIIECDDILYAMLPKKLKLLTTHPIVRLPEEHDDDLYRHKVIYVLILCSAIIITLLPCTGGIDVTKILYAAILLGPLVTALRASSTTTAVQFCSTDFLVLCLWTWAKGLMGAIVMELALLFMLSVPAWSCIYTCNAPHWMRDIGQVVFPDLYARELYFLLLWFIDATWLVLMASLIRRQRNVAQGDDLAVLLAVYILLTCGMLVSTVLAWQAAESYSDDIVHKMWTLWLIFGVAWPLAVTSLAYARSPSSVHIALLAGGWVVGVVVWWLWTGQFWVEVLGLTFY